VVDGDEILYVIARDRRRQNIDFGGVVGTQMSNLGLELALDALDVPFTRAKVGDRYVMQEMLQREWDLGGESSGHIICLDITTTGDGIVSALQALSAVVNCNTPLADLTSKMRKMPQCMVNVATSDGFDVQSNTAVLSAVKSAESRLGRSGRVLLRPSGTEPVVRVMVEGEDLAVVDELAHELSDVVAREVGSAK